MPDPTVPESDLPLQSPVSRRELLARVGNLAVAACLAGGGAGAVRMAITNVDSAGNGVVLLGTPADFKMGTVTWLKEHELFVTRNNDGLGAFSSRCTHLGCSVRRTGTGFHCPCHGARFDAMGRVVDGPARRPLTWFAVRAEADGRLWADLTSPVDVGHLTRELTTGVEEPA